MEKLTEKDFRRVESIATSALILGIIAVILAIISLS